MSRNNISISDELSPVGIRQFGEAIKAFNLERARFNIVVEVFRVANKLRFIVGRFDLLSIAGTSWVVPNILGIHES